MKKRASSPCPNRQETVAGLCYLAFQMLILPSVLVFINGTLASPLNDAELNFVFYLTNFIAVLVIFHDFLSSSLQQALTHPADLCQAVILGFVAYYACFWVVNILATALVPSYSNYNDEAIAAMNRGNSFLMLIGTVILVPPVEESFYRGLIFRNLLKKNKAVAYSVSMVAFAAIHILGYIGQYSATELIVAVVQYLPAGLCLAWSYCKGGTIFTPIFIHTAVNYLTIRTLS